MRLSSLALIFLCVLAIGLILTIRLLPIRVSEYHVDPASFPRPDTPNAFFVRDGDGDRPALRFDAPPHEVASALTIVLADALRLQPLAGSLEEGHATFVQRSAVMAYPDLISIRIEAEEGGSIVQIASRSRFGHSDLGVNERRITRWIEILEGLLGT